jgi:hypothetical protein
LFSKAIADMVLKRKKMKKKKEVGVWDHTWAACTVGEHVSNPDITSCMKVRARMRQIN